MSEKQSISPLYIIYLVGALGALLIVFFWLSPSGEKSTIGGRDQFAIIPPKAMPTVAPALRSPQGMGRTRVGIVAGHTGFDSGAVCPDGLTEQSINSTVSDLVVDMLKARGIPTDLMEEFDPALDGYVAAALVSIHADSCIYPEATGFKVASLEGSANIENEILVDCLILEYGEKTGLPYHANSITYDMTQYHAFTDIDSETPGAIIEIGFMLADRPLLTGQPELVAQGIVNGIECFLEARR
ncbi:MAG: N-acetylmuramoyl-L-alanine amidase [Anaerolineales bacterium]|nr:N-acetylmuramoyl-L-alanine amidase [Anaerolineales bacterium]